MPTAKKKIKKTSARKSTKPAARKRVATTPLNKTKRAAGKKAAGSVKEQTASGAAHGITVQEVIKQAEALHMIPVESVVHPITIEERKKLEPQFHLPENSSMRQENDKIKEVMATRKGTRNIFRRNQRRA